MKIGFTYDLKSDHAFKKGMPEDAYAELDREETIERAAQAIASGGHEVVRIGNVKQLLARLPRLDVDIVFNLCEGVGTRNRESEVPVILDLYKIPYVGSDGLTLGLTLDKAIAKKAFIADGVPTPKHYVVEGQADLLNHDFMRFPLIVKPLHEGSSKGISEDSIVADKKELRAQVREVFKAYRQPALVEEFIQGKEFTVLVIGNDPPVALTPVQIGILGKLELGNLVYTSRRVNNTDISYICPPEISHAQDKKMRDVAIAAYRSVDCRDFGRVDIRTDKKGDPYVLEVNPLPSVSDEDVFPLVAKASHMTYDELIVRIIDVALSRLGLKKGKRT